MSHLYHSLDGQSLAPSLCLSPFTNIRYDTGDFWSFFNLLYVWSVFSYQYFLFFPLTATFPFGVMGRVLETIPAAYELQLPAYISTLFNILYYLLRWDIMTYTVHFLLVLWVFTPSGTGRAPDNTVTYGNMSPFGASQRTTGFSRKAGTCCVCAINTLCLANINFQFLGWFVKLACTAMMWNKASVPL